MALLNCPACSKQVSSDARGCPHCGRPMNRRSGVGWFILLVIAAILVGIYLVARDIDRENKGLAERQRNAATGRTR